MADGVPLEKADPALVNDVAWHAVAGKRFQRQKLFVTDAWISFLLMEILIVTECFRILTFVFMAASNCERSFVVFSPLMDMPFPPASHLTWVL